MSLLRPADSALLPALAKSPQGLAGANAVRGLLDSPSTLGGRLVAAVLLATSGPGAVFAVCSAGSLLGGLVVVALPYDVPPRAVPAARCSRASGSSPPSAASRSSRGSAWRRRSRAGA